MAERVKIVPSAAPALIKELEALAKPLLAAIAIMRRLPAIELPADDDGRIGAESTDGKFVPQRIARAGHLDGAFCPGSHDARGVNATDRRSRAVASPRLRELTKSRKRGPKTMKRNLHIKKACDRITGQIQKHVGQ